MLTGSGAPAPERPMGVALVEAPGQAATAVPLGQRTTVGRDASNMLVVADSSVSNTHGILFLDGIASRYMDVSSNGTRVDGEVTQSNVKAIVSGTVLVLGDTRMTVFFSVTPAGKS